MSNLTTYMKIVYLHFFFNYRNNLHGSIVYYRTYLISTYSSYLSKIGLKGKGQSTSTKEFIQNID